MHLEEAHTFAVPQLRILVNFRRIFSPIEVTLNQSPQKAKPFAAICYQLPFTFYCTLQRFTVYFSIFDRRPSRQCVCFMYRILIRSSYAFDLKL